MFPESFAAGWIERITKPGEIILDPFCGRGTAPFQALLMKRRAVACDVNPVAFCVTRAKTNAPAISSVLRRLTRLELDFAPRKWSGGVENTSEFYQFAFDRVTLKQLLYLRSRLRWKTSDTDCMLAALILGSLHGESEKSQSYLSNQMPRTISTKPGYSVRFWKEHRYQAPKRDVFELIRKHAHFRYESDPPYGKATVMMTDMRELPRIRLGFRKPIRCVITSPPYFDVTSFEEDQWLRLWFLGGPPHPTHGRVSRDDRHTSNSKYWDLISDMWRVLGQILDMDSDVVIRIGSRESSPTQISSGLLATSLFSRRKVKMVSSEVSQIQRRQTRAFQPGTKGCLVEVDCHFRMH
jgi:hypothetical protein